MYANVCMVFEMIVFFLFCVSLCPLKCKNVNARAHTHTLRLREEDHVTMRMSEQRDEEVLRVLRVEWQVTNVTTGENGLSDTRCHYR